MNKKQLSINMISQIAAYILSLGVSFFVTSYVVKYIGTEVYGFVGLANNFMSYLSVITVALSGMINRYITVELHSGKTDKANRYYTSAIISNIALSLILAIPIIFCIAYLEKLVNVPSGYVVDIKLLWIFLFALFLIQLPTNVFSVSTFARNRLELMNLRNMESGIIKVILLFLVFSILTPHVYYIGVITLICGIYCIVLNYYYKRKLTPELQLDIKMFDIKLVGSLIKNSIWNSVQQLNIILFTGLDLLLTNIFIGAKEMSLFSIAKTLPTSVMSFVGTISGTFTPQLTITYAENDTEKFIKETKMAMKICGFLCAVPIIGLMAFGTSLFKLWIPTLSAAEIKNVQLLSILTVMPYFIDVFVHPLFSINVIAVKLKIPVLFNVVSGVLNVIIVYALLKTTSLGVFAIASISGILMILKTLFFTPFYSSHILGVKYTTFYGPLIKGIFANVVTLILFYFIDYIIPTNTWTSFIITCLVSGILGYLVNFMIYLNKEERRKICSMIKRK